MPRLLALDIGEKRIGVALSDESQLLARPLTAIRRAAKRADFEKIGKLIAEHGVERVIAGLPRTRRGEEGLQARRVRRYVEALAAAIGVPIVYQDERYTSLEAEDRLDVTRKPRSKGDIDAAAAAIILQDYLNRTLTADAES